MLLPRIHGHSLGEELRNCTEETGLERKLSFLYFLILQGTHYPKARAIGIK